jgi:hypothetical protein
MQVPAAPNDGFREGFSEVADSRPTLVNFRSRPEAGGDERQLSGDQNSGIRGWPLIASVVTSN